MEPKELVGLYEAYHQVYEPQEFDEEVEIATEYFYEMGLNGNGIDILVEELGEEEFVNWVYDIVEEYTLSEARSAKRRSGGKSYAEVKAEIDAKERAKASKKASSTQAPSKPKETPAQTKKGMGGLIGSIVQRAKQDTELLGKSIQTARDVASRRGAEVAAGYSALRAKGREAEQSAVATRARRKATVVAGRAAQAAGRTAIKAAGAAGAAAGEGVKAHRQGKTGAQIAGRAAGTFVGKMSREEYEYILEHLLDEGYATTLENAEKIAMNMSEEWVLDVLDEATAMAKRGYDETAIRNKIAKSTGGGQAADRATALENKPTYGDANKARQRSRYARAQRGDFRNTNSSNPGLHGYGHQSNDPKVKATQAARGAQRGSAALTPRERNQLGR